MTVIPSACTISIIHGAGEASPRIGTRLSPSSSGCWRSPFAGEADVRSAQSRRPPEVSHSLSPVALVNTLDLALELHCLPKPMHDQPV